MHNVSVTIVCPGPVESEIADHAFRNPSYPQQVQLHATAIKCMHTYIHT